MLHQISSNFRSRIVENTRDSIKERRRGPRDDSILMRRELRNPSSAYDHNDSLSMRYRRKQGSNNFSRIQSPEVTDRKCRDRGKKTVLLSRAKLVIIAFYHSVTSIQHLVAVGLASTFFRVASRPFSRFVFSVRVRR